MICCRMHEVFSKCHAGLAQKMIRLALLISLLVHSQSHAFHRAPWANVSKVGVLYSHSSASSLVSPLTRLIIHEASMIYRLMQEQDPSTKKGTGIINAQRFLTSSNDFTQFNDLLSEATVKIPDMGPINQDLPWPFTAVIITVSSLTCMHANLNDIQLTWNKINDQKLEVSFAIFGLEIDCSLNWEFYYDGGAVVSKIGVNGTAKVYIRNSDLSIAAAFLSKDFRYHFPNTFISERCSANINVSDITVEGSLGSKIANTFENAVQRQVETSINSVICKEFDGVDAQVTGMLNNVTAKINQYLPASDWSESDTDPLQTSTVIPKNISVLDFSTGTLTHTILDQINSYLYVGNNSVNPGTSGFNSLIQSKMLDRNGVFDVPLSLFLPNQVVFEGESTLTKTQIIVTSVRVYGLDTFTKFGPLNSISPQVLQSSLALKHLDVEADLSISIQPSTLETSLLAGSTSPVVEKITVAFGMKNIEGTVSIFLGVNLSQLGELQLGSVLHSSQITPCLFQAIHAAEITQVFVRVGDISTPNITGFISTGVDTLIVNASRATFETLKPWFLHSTPGFFEKTVRGAVNSQLRDLMSLDVKCPKPILEGQGEFVDFRDFLLSPQDAVTAGASGMAPYGDMGAKLMQLVDENFLAANPDTGLPLINEKLISPITTSQSNISGTYLVKGDLFNNDGNIDIPGLKANFWLRISNARVNNLDSVSAIRVLAPSFSDAFRLDNEAVVGTTSKPLEAECKILLNVTGDKIKLNNELALKIQLDTTLISAGLLAMVDTKALMSFPLRDIANPYCWLATIPSPQLDMFGLRLKNATAVSASLVDVNASVLKANVDLDCASCSSLGLVELGHELKTQEGVRESTNLVNHALQKLVHMMQGLFIQVQVDRFLKEASMRCPHLSTHDSSFNGIQYQAFTPPSYTDDSGSFMVDVAISLGCLTCLVTLTVLFVKSVARRKHRKWLLSLSNKDLQYINMQQVREENFLKELNNNTRAMFMSEDIPRIARFFMPIVVFGNIALFISGHLSLGAAVNIDLTIEGQKITINNFFEFSLAHSTIQMWDGGAHVLAIIIVIFSGLWPYTKQVIVLFMWFLPPRLVSVQFRSKMFYWLDILGKWSVIDIYVLIITMVAFRLSVYSPASQSSLLSSLYSVELMIVPMWGLYAMMIAQLISHVSSHFLMHYQRKIIETETKRDIQAQESYLILSNDSVDDGTIITKSNSAEFRRKSKLGNNRANKSALRHCVYEVENSSKENKLMIRSWVDFALIIIGFFAVFLFILGFLLPSFRIELLGLVGVAVELGQAGVNAANQYSLFQAVLVLIDLARYLNTPGDWIGLVALSILIIISTCVVPAVQAVATLGLWFVPMNSKTSERKKLVFFVEVLNAWQYVEVYLLALLIATWQIGGISQFFFNDVVGGKLDGVLGSMVYYGMLSPENAQMFYVVANVELGAYLLFAGAILLSILAQFIMRAEKQQSQQALTQLRENDRTSNELRAQIDYNNGFETDAALVNSIIPFDARFTDYFKWLLISSHIDSKSTVQPGSTYIGSFDVEESPSGFAGSPCSSPKFHKLSTHDSPDTAETLGLSPSEIIFPQDIRFDEWYGEIASFADDSSADSPPRDRSLSAIANKAKRWS